MKKLLISAVGLLAVCFYFSCNTASSGTSDRAKKNLDNTNAVVKMFETGDFSKTGDYIASDAVDHSGPNGEIKGVDNIKAMFNQYGGMMTNVKNEIVKELADDDYAMIWLKQSWTAKGDDPQMGLKNGETGHMETIEVTKHNADGKVTDHWGFMSMNQMMEMMKKMGNMPQGNMGNKTDTSKMQNK